MAISYGHIAAKAATPPAPRRGSGKAPLDWWGKARLHHSWFEQDFLDEYDAIPGAQAAPSKR